MVGESGLEPLVFLVSRVYSPLPSPLGYSPIWCRRRASNPRRVGLQPTALPTELPRHKLQRQSDVPSLIVNGLDFTHTVYSGR